MKIISRYILREAGSYFVISLAIFTGVLLTLRMLRFASLIVNKGVELQQIALVFLAIVPAFLEIAIPLATLLGVMLAFGRFSGDSEVIVFRSSGVSIGQLIKPVVLLAVFSAALALYVTHCLSPRGYTLLADTLFSIARSRSTAGLDDGIFNRLGNMTLYSEHIDHMSGALTKVLLDDKRNKDQRRVVSATNGEISSDPIAQTITLRLFDGYIHEIVDGKYVLTKFDTNSIVLNPNEVLEGGDDQKGKGLREMSLGELDQEKERTETLLAKIKESGDLDDKGLASLEAQFGVQEPVSRSDLKRRTRKVVVEINRRFSMPYASFILAMLAVPLGIYPPRSQKTWGAGLSAALGLGVFVVYYALLSVGIALAENGKIPPLVGLWTPNLVTTVLAGYCSYKIATEQWQSIVQGFDSIALAFRQRLRKRTVA